MRVNNNIDFTLWSKKTPSLQNLFALILWWAVVSWCQKKSTFTTYLPVKLIKGLILIMQTSGSCVDQCKSKPCVWSQGWWLQWFYRYGNMSLQIVQSAAVVSCLSSLFLRFNPLKALQPKRRLQQILASSPVPVPKPASGTGAAAPGATAPVAVPVSGPPAWDSLQLQS